MPTSSYSTFMSEAEIIIQKYVDQNPHLVMWRCNRPRPFNSQDEAEMILVGMPDENEPSLPTDLIVFRAWTWLSLSAAHPAAHIEFINGSFIEYCRVSFDGGNEPIRRVEELARKIPAVV